ncbi:hypothetical protein QE152_g7933 [Popillia japonica]|uniref:Integrase catalytic domain-containing protein n=1 Tax=Popillia japonica TaxID=7064 RepID=A0AAW1MDU0_POPJA
MHGNSSAGILQQESNTKNDSNGGKSNDDGENNMDVEERTPPEQGQNIQPKDRQVLSEVQVRKRSKTSKNALSTWEQKLNGSKREKDVQYKGKKKHSEGWVYDRPRPGRFLSDPCKRGLKGQSTVKCSTITEERRRKIFNQFWTNMSWEEKKMHVKGLVKIREDIVVCKRMFPGTLGLKERTVVEWVKDDLENTNETTISEGPKLNRKCLVRQAKSSKYDIHLKSFFDGLPKMESHYCRRSSNKLYLEPLWLTKSALYNFYKIDYCLTKQTEAVSNAKFYATFDNLNLSLFPPKKDECDHCVGFRSNNVTQEEYTRHQTLKEVARAEKSKDKVTDNVKVFTIDLQSVLLSPKTNVSSMYFKTKLIVHNFTIYNLKTKEVYCYLWNESEGQLTANEFSSILVNFLEVEVFPKNCTTNNIIIYSDGCSGQNRNVTLSNALLHVATLYETVIIQKYLLKGHTQMEVDSVHSAIERIVRKSKINLPADYIEICRKARRNPFPYNVHYLTHEFFKNFKLINQYYSSIRPGRTTGDPVVSNINGLKYENGSIQYKLRHTSEWTDLPRRIWKPVSNTPISSVPVLYGSRLKIKKEKYEHLMILLKGINQEYHDFYKNLPHY